MAVDRRLQRYFQNVRNYHLTKDEIWIEMLQIQVKTEHGPGARASARFLNGQGVIGAKSS